LRLPPALDRIWLWMIGLSAVIAFPVLAVLWAERVGWPVVVIFIGATFGAGFLARLTDQRQ